jgi:hypothetical protein
MLPVGILLAALFALLAFAPFASASNPVGSGSATITLNNGFKKSLSKKGVKILKVNPTTIKGAKVTFKVIGGSLDSAGKGTINLGGGLKFKAGKKSATVKGLVLDTGKKSLTGNVGGKKLKFASVAGFSQTGKEFGFSITIKKLKLTNPAANQLNKKLGLKGKAKAFKANQVIGGAKAEAQPSTVTVLPGGSASLKTDLATDLKLAELGVKLETVAPTTETAPLPPTFAFPIGGGTISPAGTAGIVQTTGGLKLVQEFGGGKATKLTLGAIYIDLGAKTATVEVSVESNVEFNPVGEPGKFQANLGVLGRSSIADINTAVGTITSDSAAHTVSVLNATATLQAVTAEVLNSVFGKPKGKTPFAAGNGLGTFSFTAQTQ